MKTVKNYSFFQQKLLTCSSFYSKNFYFEGYFSNAEGCETCTCKPDWMAPCSMSNYTCDTTKCLHGTYLDRNGCPSCECLPNPNLR